MCDDFKQLEYWMENRRKKNTNTHTTNRQLIWIRILWTRWTRTQPEDVIIHRYDYDSEFNEYSYRSFAGNHTDIAGPWLEIINKHTVESWLSLSYNEQLDTHNIRYWGKWIIINKSYLIACRLLRKCNSLHLSKWSRNEVETAIGPDSGNNNKRKLAVNFKFNSAYFFILLSFLCSCLVQFTLTQLRNKLKFVCVLLNFWYQTSGRARSFTVH